MGSSSVDFVLGFSTRIFDTGFNQRTSLFNHHLKGFTSQSGFVIGTTLGVARSPTCGLVKGTGWEVQ